MKEIGTMRRSVASTAMVLIALTSLTTAQSPATSANTDRKINSRVAPNYPDLAKKMHIHGVVKVEAIVRPNGSVRSARALGGNPVLVDAAIAAVGKWKFDATQTESTEVVQVAFEEE